jgi:hypothetical protein
MRYIADGVHTSPEIALGELYVEVMVTHRISRVVRREYTENVETIDLPPRELICGRPLASNPIVTFSDIDQPSDVSLGLHAGLQIHSEVEDKG